MTQHTLFDRALKVLARNHADAPSRPPTTDGGPTTGDRH